MTFYAGATLPDHLWRTLIEIAEKERPDNPQSMALSWGLTETAPAALMSNRHGAEIGNIGAPPGVTLKLNAGEITDKGWLNSCSIRERRKAILDRLYNDRDPDVIWP